MEPSMSHAIAPDRHLILGWQRPQRLRLLMLFVLDWSVIALALTAWEWTHRLALLPALCWIIGARQHALAVLMHETVHRRLARRWNASAVLGRLCVWPLFISWSSYRNNHLAHHRHLNGDRDPDLRRKLCEAPSDWKFPKRVAPLAMLLAKDLLGYGLVSNFRLLFRFQTAGGAESLPHARGNPDPLVLRLLFTAAFVGGWIAGLGWQSFVLLWLLPLFTTLPFLIRIRSIADHLHMSASRAESTRTVTASWFEREILGFGPHLSGYHAAHHRFPAVACHSLKQLHAALRADPSYIRNCCTTDSYVFGRRSLVRELNRV
jgi:fatty acid desaturase